MFSMPPAMPHSLMPAQISCATLTMAWAPEPHTRLTVSAGTSTGSPAAMPAWRAGFMRAPAWITWPITSVWMRSGASPARRTVSRMATAPRSGAGRSFKLPP
jgi:hypothetical protein